MQKENLYSGSLINNFLPHTTNYYLITPLHMIIPLLFLPSTHHQLLLNSNYFFVMSVFCICNISQRVHVAFTKYTPIPPIPVICTVMLPCSYVGWLIYSYFKPYPIYNYRGSHYYQIQYTVSQWRSQECRLGGARLKNKIESKKLI